MKARPEIWRLIAVAGLLALLLISDQLTQLTPVSHWDTQAVKSVATPRAAVVPNRVVFVGDSYTQGAGAQGVGWADILSSTESWDAINLSRGGTGYVPKSFGNAYKFECTKRHCFSFLDQVIGISDRRAQIIFVAGGRNDIVASAKEMDKYSAEFFARLRKEAPEARVYVVSPFWASGEYPAWLAERGRIIRANAKRAGFTYLDVGNPLAARSDLIVQDGVHPNAEGYRILASAVDTAYRKSAR